MAAHPPYTILIVGHARGWVVTLVGLLHRQGYTVVTASTGALAWSQLPVRPYEVILCALDRPESDGHAFYALLQQDYPALCPRVIFLTDDTMGATDVVVPQEGGQTLVHKTCGVTEVLGAIAQVRGMVHSRESGQDEPKQGPWELPGPEG